MKYNVGDRVLVKSIDWYNKNKDEDGNIDINHDFTFYADRSRYCGKVFTIVEVFDNCYAVKEDNNEYYWSDEMIEGLADSIEDRMKELRKMCTISLNDSNYTDKVEILLNDYEYTEENGKAYFVKKKKEYPKTYEECCKIMNCAVHPYITANEPGIVSYYEDDLNRGVLSLRKLLICRDAYWKIAGEEMGLGKPWEPDWTYNGATKYCIGVSENEIQNFSSSVAQYILAFPTEEMRDTFKKNFDPDIEICKEFL